MARVKGAMMTRKRRNKVLKAAKGYWGAKSKHFRMAKQAVMKSGNYAFAGRKLKKRDFPFSPINHVKDMLTDEQALVNGFIQPYQHRNGKTTLGSTSPVQYISAAPIEYMNAPLLGEHGEEILKDLGYTGEQIAAMIESKALRITKM